MDFTD